MKLSVSKRLLCCGAQVPPDSRVADIGCDHGYLSIHLLQTGRAVFSHACDLREQPLKKAMENALRHGVAEKMRFSRADGLHAVDPEQIDVVVCAGMGGDLIAHILSEAPWLKNEKYCLILQPQSSGQDLRRFLSQEGFGIEGEALVEDGGFLYNVITARYGAPTPLSPGQQYCPPPLLESGEALLPRYLERIEGSLAATVESFSRAARPVPEEKLKYYRTALAEIQEMKERISCPR